MALLQRPSPVEGSREREAAEPPNGRGFVFVPRRRPHSVESGVLPKRAMALTLGAALLAAAACKPVVVKEGIDASAEYKECPPKPIPFCDAMAPGPNGCNADPK